MCQIMTTNLSTPINLVKVRGTELLASDTHEQYRQKLARITLDSMVQFVGLLDAKGTVLEINHVALDAVGIKLSDVEGKPFWTTFWWQVSEEINATLRESILRASQGEFVRWDTEIYGRAGGKETITIDASLMPVKDEHGNVVFITAEGRDITQKKAHEREIARQRAELAELDKLKTQFFANISHEFRTPLTLMMGPLEDAMAEKEGLSASNRERLEVAHRNSLRLLKLVNTLLDFSRIEAGRIQASYEPTDLAILTTELASVFRSAIERAGMRLLVDCPALPEKVYVDREMWEKVLLNLLSNAFKFTLEGEIEVSLRLVDSAVEMKVRDTGTGVPATEIPRLFERFHRVKGARGRSYEGSGIGLALVQELVKLHGGNVHVQSEADRGSTFTVTIPLGKDHLPAGRIGSARTMGSTGLGGEVYVQEALRWLPETQDAEEGIQIAPLFSPPDTLSHSAKECEQPSRILVADDNADMRDYVQRLLSKQYEIVAVADGESALKSARERHPDLILSDIMMPRLDGFELLRTVRADRELKSIPVILLSARAGEESRVEGLEAGADDYLVKPFSARELLARVGSHIAMAKIRREAADQFRTLSERLDAEVRLRTQELQQRNVEVVEQSEMLRELSNRMLKTQDEERRRMARELHDSAGQIITALGMGMANIGQKVRQNPPLAKALEENQDLLLQLNKEIRTMSYLLHPPLLDENGLSEAIRWYTQGLSERSGLNIEVTTSESFGRLDADMELAIFRIVQECLTNIHRHSGSRTATIRLSRRSDTVSVEVQDQGKGISEEKLAGMKGRSGVGIAGMRERVRHYTGTLDILSNGNGTKIAVSLPIPVREVSIGEGLGERSATA
jgi:PAS domain S-box-containing protein